MNQTIEELIEELEAVLVEKPDFHDCMAYEEWANKHNKTIRDTLTQAIAIAKGESVVVPREPTDKQRDAFYNAMRSQGYKTIDIAGINEVEIYKAMITAAQHKQEGATDD